MRPVQSAAGRSFIEPGSPWQNPFVESSGSRVRDQVLSAEAFDLRARGAHGHH
ncbi:MAG TPA: integrase core domain-containing protein [Streptosporangiaceae bacterium]